MLPLSDRSQRQLTQIIGDADTATQFLAQVTGAVDSGATYSDPSWITSLAASKVVGDIAGNAASITGAIAESQVTGLVTDLAGKLTANQTIVLSGDISGSGTVAIAATIGAGKVTNSMLAGSIAATKLVGSDITIAESQVTSLTSDLALKANLAGPTFTGVPAAPTAAAATNTTQLATTAFATTADNLKANLASPTLTGTPAAPTAAAGTNTTQLATTAFVQAAIQEGHAACQGRLTLTTLDPIAGNVTGTTIYFTPYGGNVIGLYDGSTTWNMVAFSEASLVASGNFSGTGVYDIFGYNNAGTLTLEAVVWTSTGNLTGADGARATALVLQDGVLVKSGATTRRYLGTICSISGTVKDTAQFRYVWNFSNRIPKKLSIAETTASWTYATNSFRAINNDANSLSSFEVVCGYPSAWFTVTQLMETSCAGGQAASIGIGYDSASADVSESYGLTQASSISQIVTAKVVYVSLGRHTIYAIESASGATVTFYGGGRQSLFGSYPC